MLTCAVGVTLEIMLRQKAVMLMNVVIEDSQLYDLSTTRDTSRSQQHTQVHDHLHHILVILVIYHLHPLLPESQGCSQNQYFILALVENNGYFKVTLYSFSPLKRSQLF